MKRIIILFFLGCTIPLMAQHTDHIQEAIANYDYRDSSFSYRPKEINPSPTLTERQSVAGTRTHHRGTFHLRRNYL